MDLNEIDMRILDLLTKIEEAENTIVDTMVEWFRKHYEDPAESLPVDGGEYVWLVDECNAREELQTNFDNVPDPLIEQAVAIIEVDGDQWVSLNDLKHISD